MPTLSIRFVGGHYHATPWNSAQNEGAVEWPPSPWRVLRALIATGYAKLPQWQQGIMPDIATSLIKKLASVLPVYYLPEATGAHTRHYMPIKGKTTLVIDARAVTGINHQPLLIHWDIALTADEHALFAELAVRLAYLGRAESWTECAVVADRPVTSDWVQPCEQVHHSDIDPGREQIALIAPVSPEEYAQWRTNALNKECALKKPSAKQLKVFNTNYPVDLVDCLQAETGWLQARGWSQPPGSRKALYCRPARNTIGVTAPVPTKALPQKPVQFVLLALVSDARSRSPMPLVSRTLPQAELLHQTIASFVGKTGTIQAAAELLGQDHEKKHLTGRHLHTHILPLPLLKKDKHLDHILIWTPGGLSDVSQRILRQIRKTYMKGGVGTVSVRFVGTGPAEDMMSIQALQPVLRSARVWQSQTPFVLPRYRKPRGRNTPDNQVIAELASRGLPEPEKIEWLQDESIHMRHFVRLRRRSAPPENYGYALRLTFTDPVTGPICLGYASHFGLGLFASVK